jgi:8-oxo-dGTP pyrophosphatase MutT (NUDIX family)
MYKVFFNDRTIFLDDVLPDMTRIGQDYVCAFENVTDLKPQLWQFLEPGKEGNLYIFHDDQESLFKTFSHCFTNVLAGGGLVRNPDGEILVIFRRGKWDLPKGKAEKDESPEECALREVGEETGLEGIRTVDFLKTTHHIYPDGDHFILKRTDWYHMSYNGSDQPRPLTSEDITEVKWFSPSGLTEIFDNTYASIREVIQAAL